VQKLPELVGRDEELREIETLVRSARAGGSGSVVLSGAQGIGKTAILDYAAGLADGMVVIRASGIEAESELTFAGLSQLLTPLPTDLDLLPAPQAAALRAALALGPPVPGDPFAVSLATLGLLAAAAEEAGLVALVDDAHWLDAASLRALLFASQRLGAEGVALLFGWRADVPSPFDQSRVRPLHIGPLSDEAARALLCSSERPLAPPVATVVRETAAGNPLALLELPKLLTAEQAAGRAPLPDPLPTGAGIRRLFGERIAALSPDARHALLLIAASDPETAAAIVCRLDPTAVEEAESAGILALGNGIGFRHPLMRSAAYWGATESERRAAHRLIAQTLPDTRPLLARAWHQALATVGRDDGVAAELAAGAVDAASRGAHGSAGRALEHAARLTVDPEVRAERLVAAAENLQLIGRFDEASALLHEAIATTSDPRLQGRAYLTRGQVLIWVGSPHEAHAILSEGATRLEPTDVASAVLLRAESAHALLPAGYPRRALAIAERARVAASEAGSQPFLVASAAVAQASVLLGEAKRSAAVLAEAEGAVESADPVNKAHLMMLRASFLAILGQHDESRAILEAVIGTGRGQSAPSLLPYPLAGLAYIDYRTGRWTRAYAEASEAVELAQETGQLNILTFSLCALSQVEAGFGRARASWEHTARALELARSIGSDTIELYAGAARLLAALGDGQIEDAIAAGEPAARLFEERGYREPAVAQLHGDLFDAYLRAGRRGEAERFLDGFADLARVTGGAWALGVTERCRGLLAEDDSFEDSFDTSLQELGRANAPFEIARTQLCLGERRRRARRRTDARVPLRAALETFHALGARAWTERAARELRACGGSTGDQEANDPTEELTPHELQVALVVARGATNREAASQLFVSPKTIDFHLRNVYRKLDIRSRSQLAGMFAGL
jgi:DNA-binding CsgD family transcriptional regulator